MLPALPALQSDTIDKVNRLQVTALGATAVSQGLGCGGGAEGRALRRVTMPAALHAVWGWAGLVHIYRSGATAFQLSRLTHLPATLQQQLQGIGSSARILQGDIAACGPAVIHVIDQARSCTPERGAVCSSRRSRGAHTHVPAVGHVPACRAPSASLILQPALCCHCRCCCPSLSTSRPLMPSPARRRPWQMPLCQARCLSPAGADPCPLGRSNGACLCLHCLCCCPHTCSFFRSCSPCLCTCV